MSTFCFPFESRAERALPFRDFLTINGYKDYDITEDARQFLVVVPANQAESSQFAVPQIIVVLNWFEELKERMPVD